MISDKPIHIVFSIRDNTYSAAIMQEDDVDPDKYRSLAFIGKILPDVQRRYLPPEISFTCMGDVLKRCAYMLLGKRVHLYTANYWKELDDPWQYLHRRIQKPLLRIREFGAEIHTITTKMQKMYNFLQTFPILGEAEMGKNKIPRQYSISDRSIEIEPDEGVKLNYFGIELSVLFWYALYRSIFCSGMRSTRNFIVLVCAIPR